MKRIFKRLSAAVIALAVMVTAVVFDIPGRISALAASAHTDHKVCGDLSCSDSSHENITWEEWTSDNTLPASGNYYLNTDVKLSQWAVISGNLTLCLNGHTIDAQQNSNIFDITGSLTLCDCSNGKTGTLTGGRNTGEGGGVFVGANGTFTMYGGTISGNLSNANNISYGGGGVYVKGTFTMYNGTISGNTTTKNGGGVRVSNADGGNPTFTMFGGNILNNTAGCGGGVYVSGKNATFTMNGGTISGNKTAEGSDGNGGGVYVDSYAKFIMNDGAIISKNTSTGTGSDAGGGGVYVGGGYNAKFEMNGGTISGNTARYGGGVYVSSITSFEMNGGKIGGTGEGEGNTAETYGGGVYVQGGASTQKGTFTMSDGSILGNVAKSAGGGVFLYSHSTFTMNKGTISGNTATTNGGGVHFQYGTLFTINGEVNISDNTKKGGSADNVYLINRTITVGDDFSTDSTIGVSTFPAPTSCTTPKDVTGAAPDVSEHFKADISGQSIVYNGGKVQLIVAHNWGEWTITTDPSETDKGEATRNCTTTEEHTDIKELPELTDTEFWTKTTKDPTCTEDGSDVYESEYGTVTVEVPKLTDTVWTKTETAKPTISADGEYIYSSEDYGTVTVTVPKLTDNIWTKTETAKPTISADGEYTYSSGYGTVAATVPKLNNTDIWTKTETAKPTISADGLYTYSSDYGTVTVDVPKLTDPLWTKEETKKPTENTDGEYTYTNDDFGEVRATVPKLSDTSVWTKDDTKHVDNTEEHDGRDVYNSDIYGTVEVVLPQLDHEHDWGKWSITTPPTIDTNGTATRVCKKFSSHTETITVPKLADPEWTKTENKNPTIKDNGEYTYTSENYGDVTVTVPKLSEDPWTKTENTKSTVKDNGEYTYKSGYGDITVTVPKLSDESVWTKTENTKPTLDTDGEYTYESGYGKETVTVPKLSDESVWTKNDTKSVVPTEEHDGKDVYTSVYGEADVKLDQLPHEHDWGKWSITTAPTIDTAGEALRTCKKFASHTETSTVPALTDPQWTKNETKKPTISESGTYTYTSTDYGTVTSTVPKLTDPSWTKTETQKPTIKDNGEYTYKSDYGDVTVTVPKLSDETVWTKTENTKPTLDTDGEYTYESSYGEETVTVPKLSDDTVWTKDNSKHVEPTDDEDGKDVYKSEYGEIEVILPTTGSISKQVQSNGNAPAAKLPESGSVLAEAVLTEADKSSVENDGAQIKILLIIDDATNSISAEDKTAVETAIGGLTNYKPGQYLDVNLFKVIDGVQNPITETKAALTITFEVPAAFRGSGRTYSVIRVHGGKTTVLDDLDSDPDTVTIKTDKFSTYALTYQEETTSSTPGGSGGSGSGSSGGRPSRPGGGSSTRPGTSSDTTSSDTTSSGSTSGDTTSSGSTSGDTTSSGSTSGDSTSSGSTSGDSTSSGSTSGDSTSSGSTSSGTASSNDSFASDESTHTPSENGSSEGGDNPATGIAISFIPLAAALAVATVTIKRRRK